METNQQNQDEIEIDLLELLRVLWSKIGYVILAALALGLLMVLVSKVFMKPQYESTTKMYVLSKQDSSSTVTSGDLQASSLLTKDYAELIQRMSARMRLWPIRPVKMPAVSRPQRETWELERAAR